MTYRREIDGLRTLAVVPVILFHAGFQTFSGGFVGVDVFFVISGYLITSIILAEKQAGIFSLISFYERRARRILPALFVVMFACLPFAWMWLLPAEMNSFSQSIVAVSVFSSNIFYYLKTNYFDTAAEQSPLIHTWSLAVEEQYYLFFPIFLLLTWRSGKQWTVAMLAVIAMLSLAVAQWGSLTHPAFTFFLLPTRGWELLVGALVAFFLFARESDTTKRARISQSFSAIGLFLITYSVLAFDKQTPFPGFYALMPTIGAALIILFATRQTFVGKVLGSKLFVGIGLVSYSAYLWHQPLFAFARHRSIVEPSKLLLLVLAVLALLLAYFSWKYVETPFRNRECIKRKQVLIYGSVCSVFLVTFGLVGYVNKGYPDSFNRVPDSVLTIKDIELPRAENGWCFYSANKKENPVGDKGLQCFLGDKDSVARGLLFGDSFAGQYEPFWDIVGKESSISINSVTAPWCYPSLTNESIGSPSNKVYEQCLFNRRYLENNFSNYDFVIFGGNWGSIDSENKMRGVYDAISSAAKHTKLVILMASPAQFDLKVGSLHEKLVFYDMNFAKLKLNRHRDRAAIEANQKLEELAKKHTNVFYIDRDSMFNLDGIPSDVSKTNVPFSLDGVHISIYGSKVAAYSFLKTKKYVHFFEATLKMKHINK
jgi:peptidoglycan/LPS O-acetylase OafA/YrhL